MPVYLLKNFDQREYQKKAIDFMLYNKKVICAADIGTGKTAITVAALVKLKNSNQHLKALIICRSPLKYQWKAEIERFCDLDFIVIDGSPRERQNLYNTNATITIISYDTLISKQDLEKLKNVYWDAIVCDEVTEIKNFRTRRSKAVRHLKADHRWGLTGSPIENRLEELYSIMLFINSSVLGNWRDFQNEYFIMQEKYGYHHSWMEVIGYKNTDKLKDKMRNVMYTIPLNEALPELPERSEKLYLLEMSDEQKKIYRIIQDEAKLALAVRQNPLAKLMLLRQVANDPRTVEEFQSVAEIGNKIQEIENILKELNGQSVVIFANFKKFAYLIKQRLELLADPNYNIYMISGDNSAKEKQDIVDAFNRNAGALISTEVGVYGFNLQHNCHILINASLNWNPMKLKQQAGRVHRYGQTERAIVINLISKGTVDEKIWQVLTQKTDLINLVLGLDRGTIDIETNREFLNYLLE